MVKANAVARSASKCIKSITKRPGKTAQGTTLDDELKKANAEALGEIISHLTEFPQKILPALKVIQNPSFGVQKAAPKGAKGAAQCGDEEEPWPDTYGVWRLIPKYWLWAWVVGVQPKFTPELVERVDAADKRAIRKILEFATGRKDTSTVPTACCDKLIMARTLTQAYKDLGSRLSDSWVEAILPTGVIDWNAHGV